VRASAVVGRVVPGSLSPAAAQQRNALIRGIAWELDKLALPLRTLTEACHPLAQMEGPAVPGGEIFRTALTRATDALTRFQGQPGTGAVMTEDARRP